MRQSQLPNQPVKESKQYDSVNATLLIKAGYIDQVMSGVFTYMPLGIRVLQKIEQIVREEMDKVGSEILMPSIVPTELWRTTGRIDTIDSLFRVIPANDNSKSMNDSEYILNPTHEDVVTPLIKKTVLSYKDLPKAVYQIQTKFRNEPRPKSGLLRCREFRMKDLYSFHVSEEDMLAYYEKVKEAYFRVFARLGMGDLTYYVKASGGSFTDKFSNEFQTRVETGEDLIFHVPNTDEYYNKEVAPSKAPIVNSFDTEMKAMDSIEGVGVIGVDDLVEHLNVTADHSIKTLIYRTDTGEVIVAAVRGDYDINEIKLKKLAGCKSLELADAETVIATTGAEIGYAGIVNLPENVRAFIDDSTEPMVNFECGANRTNFHNVNVNWERDVKRPEQYVDIKVAKVGDIDPVTDQVYETFKACEAGNIFPLNTRFTDAFDYKFIDEKGEEKPVFMASYGIGTSRAMGILVELFHDEKGIIWPDQVAPFKAHLIVLGQDEAVIKKAEALYSTLTEKGVEVLFDDRYLTPGAKFADSDLIGIPYRLVVSPKTGDLIEVKRRDSSEFKLITEAELLELLG